MTRRCCNEQLAVPGADRKAGHCAEDRPVRRKDQPGAEPKGHPEGKRGERDPDVVHQHMGRERGQTESSQALVGGLLGLGHPEEPGGDDRLGCHRVGERPQRRQHSRAEEHERSEADHPEALADEAPVAVGHEVEERVPPKAPVVDDATSLHGEALEPPNHRIAGEPTTGLRKVGHHHPIEATHPTQPGGPELLGATTGRSHEGFEVPPSSLAL